tara:strand:+ start:344 stop:652 length:309 start_codon:yes stop_codon:yes gene_type:complete
MLKMNTIVADQATTATGSSVEQSATPYLPGTTCVAVIDPAGFTGTAIIQGSDDNSSWSTLHTSGSVTTDSGVQMKEVTLPKYVRHNTTRSAGTVSMYIMNAG